MSSWARQWRMLHQRTLSSSLRIRRHAVGSNRTDAVVVTRGELMPMRPMLQLNRLFSTQQQLNPNYNPRADPGQFVEGATLEQMDSDPEFAEYMKINFPQVYDPNYNEDGLGEFAGVDDRIMEILKRDKEEKKQFLKEKQEKREFNKLVYPRNIRPWKTFRRSWEETNSRQGRALRKQKLIPGIVYGGDKSLGISSRDPDSRILVKTPHNQFQREFNRYRWNLVDSRVYNLTVHEHEEDEEGTTHLVVPKHINWYPVKYEVFCVNFCRYHPMRPLKIPVRNVNEEDSPALKRECFIIPIQRKIEVLIEEGADIPDFLDLDCTGLEVKDVIRRDRMILPDGVRFSDNVMKRRYVDYVIGKCEGSTRDFMNDDSTTDESTATEESPGAGTGTDTKDAAA